MRIEGTDASGTQLIQVQNSRTQNSQVQNSNAGKKDTMVNVIESKNISQMTNAEKKELPVSEKLLIDAIEKANKAIAGANREFKFSIHAKTKAIMVKVIDSDTNEVVREIPPEKILDMVARMWEMAGILVDERR